MKLTISIIAAIGSNRELGKNNKLLWDIPEDMKHFREITRNHPVIMGRKTFESIGHPLPNRLNIIITSKPSLISPTPPLAPRSLSEVGSTLTAPSLEKALELAICHCEKSRFNRDDEARYKTVFGEAISKRDRRAEFIPLSAGLAMTKIECEIFIIGGGQIYQQGIKYADKLYLTLVKGTFDADTYFPDYSEFKKVISSQKGSSNGYDYEFLELEK